MRFDRAHSRIERRRHRRRKYDDRLKKRRHFRDDNNYNDHHSRNDAIDNQHHSYYYSKPDSSSRIDDREIVPSPSSSSYYKSTETIHDRRTIHSRHECSPSLYSSSYRNIGNDYSVYDQYRSSIHSTLTPLSTHSSIDSYNETPYRASDYNSRSERYDTELNRHCSTRAHSIKSNYRTDSYRTSSPIPISSSSYTASDPYVESFPSMTTSMNHHQINPYNSSDRYHDEHHSSLSSSYRNRSNSERTQSNLNDYRSKRAMR